LEALKRTKDVVMFLEMMMMTRISQFNLIRKILWPISQPWYKILLMRKLVVKFLLISQWQASLELVLLERLETLDLASVI
jgi:hypothetical protein